MFPILEETAEEAQRRLSALLRYQKSLHDELLEVEQDVKELQTRLHLFMVQKVRKAHIAVN